MRLNNVAHWRTWNTPLSTGIVVLTSLALTPLFGWALAVGNWRALVALIAMVMVPVVVRWPVVSAFGLYAFLVPFDSISAIAEAGGGTPTRLAGLLAGGVLLVAGLMERRLRRPPWAALWWGLLVLWAAFSAAWAINPANVFGMLPTLLSLFALYITAVCIKPTRRELYGVCLMLVIAGSLAAGAGYFYGLDDVRHGAARGRLVIGDRESNPNALGAALVLPFVFAIAGFVGLRGAVQKTLAGGSVALIGLGIYISSRGALVALIALLAVLLYRLRLRWPLLVAILMLVALVATLPAELSVRIMRVFTGEDTTGSGRTDIWAIGVDAIQGFGIFGAGLSNFVEAYRVYFIPSPSHWGRAAHNTYLMVWVELGVVGLGLMLAALGSQLLALHKARKAGGGGVFLVAVEAACVGQLTLMLFGDEIYKKAFWLCWILLTWATYGEGGSVAAGATQREEARASLARAKPRTTNPNLKITQAIRACSIPV